MTASKLFVKCIDIVHKDGFYRLAMCDTSHKGRFYRLTEANELMLRVWERIQCCLSHTVQRLPGY